MGNSGTGLKELLDCHTPHNYAEDAVSLLAGKDNIILFGAAEYGKIICDYFRARGIHPLCYSDNSPEKAGGTWNGLGIMPPGNITNDHFVVITCNAFREITNQLVTAGIPEEHIFFFDVKWLTHPNGKRDFIMGHISELEKVYDGLADEKSRNVFLDLLNYKLTYKPEYVQAVADDRQYFDPELVRLPGDACFIDAGSYTGDTLDAFVEYTGGAYGKAVCMEPVRGNIMHLRDTVARNQYHDVQIYEIGASDRKKTLRFDSRNGMAARPAETGDTVVECDSIDNICMECGCGRVDFIKMDVEGSEYDALRGAKNVIRKWHPLLAVCVYHREEDFYVIPGLIKELYPGYRIYFRHYELSDEETVCYAIPEERVEDDSRAYKNRISEFHRIDGNRIYPEYPFKGLHIELSNICNHKCLFCATRKMSRKKGFMDEAFLKRILQEAYDEGFREVGYYANGEPFVSADLDQYIRWAKETGFSYVYIDTNGGVEFEKIKKTIDAGLDSIKFSINGTNANNYRLIHGRDDFGRAIDNLRRTYGYKKVLGRPLNVYVSIAVTRYTEDSVDRFADECRQYCDDIIINSVIEMGGYIGEEMKYLQSEKTVDFNSGMTIPCYLLWNSLFVTYEGYATACCADYQNYLVYADLNRTTLREAWNSEILADMRRKHLEGNIDGLPCVACVYGKREAWVPLIEQYASVCGADVFGGYDIEKRIAEYEAGIASGKGRQ